MVVERVRIRQFLMRDTDAIYDDKVILCLGVWRDRLKVCGVDDPYAATLHLLEEVTASHTAHEHHDFEWLDVRAGSDHVHRDDDPRVIAVAE